MEDIKTNKMGIVPVKKLLILMGIPMIISMVLQAVYNIVDSAFVGRMTVNGEEALNALALAFPVQMLIISFGIGTGVGANALLSKSLGKGDFEKVNTVAGNTLFMGGVIYVIFALFGIFGVDLYVKSQTDNPIVIEMAVKYLRICCISSFGLVLFTVYEKLLQSTGKSVLSTIAQISGAVTNLILDPILIYEWGAELGIVGAAWATVIGQIVSAVVAIVFHLVKNKEVKNHIKYLRPRGKILLEIYIIGLPAIISQALMSFMTYGMNIILKGVSENYVTAYGTFYKIQQFVLFIAFGLRDAITPVVSFNYGRKNIQRVKEGIKFGIIYTVAIMAVGLLLMEAIANPLVAVFNLSETTAALCVQATRIISASFVFAGLCVALQGIFQALGSGLASLIISVCRQLLFVIPVVLGFSYIVKANPETDWLLWFAFIISELLSAVIAVFMMRNIYNKKVTVLQLPQNETVASPDGVQTPEAPEVIEKPETTEVREEEETAE